MNECLYALWWCGPFTLEQAQNQAHESSQAQNVLYMVCGPHVMYGRNVPLYIGKTLRSITTRMKEHAKSWLDHQPDPVAIYVASIWPFTTWQEYEHATIHTAEESVVDAIEKLLIYAHQPVYNTSNKNSIDPNIAEYRVFNTGRYSCLLPELSTRYYFDRTLYTPET